MQSIPDKIKILYIEDDKDSAVITLKYLKAATISEFVVVHMCTLTEGLEYLEAECRLEQDCEIDVILIDLILPNSKGINTYKAVVDKCSFIPVVIISEHSDMAIACVRLGAQDYLFKPDFNGGTLTRSLTYAVQRDYLRKQFERERDISKMYLDVAGVMLLVIDSDQKISMINKKGCEILECSEKEALGLNWFDNFIPERLRSEIKNVYDQVVSGDVKASEFYSNPIVTKKGNEKWISWHNTLIRNNDRIITGVLSSGEDITERMTAQELLKKSETQFRNLVEFTKAGMYTIDFINNKFIYVNDVLCEQLGYTRDELLNLGPYDVLTKPSVEDWFTRWERLKQGEFIDNAFEYQAIRKDGSIAWALITAEYIEDDDKTIIGANVVAIDITEKKEAQIALEQKEVEVYLALEKKVNKWKDELNERGLEKERNLKLIDAEILTITKATNSDEVI
jgi:PAS domain S-box-containing protein